MSLNFNQYLPFAVLILILLSLRTSQPSIRNFVTAMFGAVIAWFVTPANSAWGIAASFGLTALAFALSPFMTPLSEAVRKAVPTILRWAKMRISEDEGSTRDEPVSEDTKLTSEDAEPVPTPKNPPPMNTLHDPPGATVE